MSSGGVRCIAYVGVVQALEAAGIDVASVSGCSAGAVLGALVAGGLSGDELEMIVREADLERLGGWERRVRRMLALRRWPFAPSQRTGFADLVAKAIGADVTFEQLPKPYATVGIDMTTGDFLVYSKGTHPKMLVADAVRIATAVPLAYPPHHLGDRIVVDAAVATESPVWLAAALEGFFDKPLPILLLRSARSAHVETPRHLGQFLERLFMTTIAGRDALLIRGDPRIHPIDLPTNSVSPYQFKLDSRERARLIGVGRHAAEQLIDRVDGDFAAAQLHLRSAGARLPGGSQAEWARRHDETAAWAGAHYAQRFLDTSPREVFISYAHDDAVWFEKLLQILKPHVSAGAITVWTDRDIQTGEFWKTEIAQAMGRAAVALLLVSPSYLDSDFVAGNELPALIRAAEERRTVLLWLHVTRSTYKATPIGDLQATHDPGRPLDSLDIEELEKTLNDVADEVVRSFSGV